MFLTSTRRYVLLMAATVLAAGATSLSAPAFAATASQNPKVPDTCGWILTDDGSNPCVSSGTSVARGGDTGAAPPEDPSDAGGEDTGTDQAPPEDPSGATGGDTGTGTTPHGEPSDAAGGDTGTPPGGAPSGATGGDTGTDQNGGLPGDDFDYGIFTPPATGGGSGPVVN
ncbi:hypothetical protein [Streptomyces cinereospinus]|uniref:Uncharacterized protein n=1 Tax=Streptomyces cinereospinus TaxID=285561 RepID=A0ABV5N0E7_9ACTN